MADTSLNENRLSLLIWQTSNLWQSKVRHKLKESQITLNEYLILETIYLLQQENINITPVSYTHLTLPTKRIV